MPRLDDDGLMARVAAGDLAAFGLLVEAHQDWAWRVAYRYLHNDADSKDAVQDAFLKVFRAAGRYRASGTFAAYLARVLANHCLDMKRGRRPLAQLHEEGLPAAMAVDPLELGEHSRRIEAALGTLPGRQRMAVILRYFEDMSYAQTGEAMEASTKAVERLLSKALKTLRSSPLLRSLGMRNSQHEQ